MMSLKIASKGEEEVEWFDLVDMDLPCDTLNSLAPE